MSKANETIADIIAEMRERAEAMQTHGTTHGVKLAVREFADRIEAAWKREKAEWEAAACAFVSDAVMSGKVAVEHAPFGNAAAMREALEKCREIALQWQADEADGVAGTTDKPSARSAAEAVIDMEFEINAALAKPPRNCDIGTEKEQEMRFSDYCRKHYDLTFDLDSDPCKACPFFAMPSGCRFAWAQMPYEAEGAEK